MNYDFICDIWTSPWGFLMFIWSGMLDMPH